MDINTVAKLSAPIFTALVSLIVKKYLEERPRLIIYLIHASAIPLHDDQGSMVNTHSIVVRNSGKKTAKNVRIGHQNLPDSYQIFPPLTHEVIRGDDNTAEILIPTIVPDEQVNVSYLYFPPMTWNQINSYCKSDEMSAKGINVVINEQANKFYVFVLWLILFIGGSTIVYWLFINIWDWVH